MRKPKQKRKAPVSPSVRKKKKNGTRDHVRISIPINRKVADI